MNVLQCYYGRHSIGVVWKRIGMERAMCNVDGLKAEFRNLG